MSNYYDDDDVEELVCAGCGKSRDQWAHDQKGEESSGVVAKAGQIYCCEACAKHQKCSCESRFDEQGSLAG